METPRYLNSLESVAKQFGGLTEHRILGERIHEAWRRLENYVQPYSYDVLAEYIDVSYLTRLVDLLYMVPGADWRKDCTTLRAKDKEYGGSWHRRGGPGAFMMLARKFDRIDNAMTTYGDLGVLIAKDERDEGILDDLTDLRCYLLLVLAWHSERLAPQPEPTQLEIEGPF